MSSLSTVSRNTSGSNSVSNKNPKTESVIKKTDNTDSLPHESIKDRIEDFFKKVCKDVEKVCEEKGAKIAQDIVTCGNDLKQDLEPKISSILKSAGEDIITDLKTSISSDLLPDILSGNFSALGKDLEKTLSDSYVGLESICKATVSKISNTATDAVHKELNSSNAAKLEGDVKDCFDSILNTVENDINGLFPKTHK